MQVYLHKHILYAVGARIKIVGDQNPHASRCVVLSWYNIFSYVLPILRNVKVPMIVDIDVDQWGYVGSLVGACIYIRKYVGSLIRLTSFSYESYSGCNRDTVQPVVHIYARLCRSWGKVRRIDRSARTLHECSSEESSSALVPSQDSGRTAYYVILSLHMKRSFSLQHCLFLLFPTLPSSRRLSWITYFICYILCHVY